MGAVNVRQGDFIVLRLVLPKQDSTRFVRAIVKGDNGVSLPGSPFTLVNLGNGRYSYKDEINLIFPLDPSPIREITADYEVYNDALFTQLTSKYSQEQDVWRRLDSEEGLLAIAINELIETVNNIGFKFITMAEDLDIHIVEDDKIEAVVEYNDNIDALVEDDETVEAIVSENDSVGAEVSDDSSLGAKIDG